ncbi:STAS domain-containing protein [Bacillus sp. MUM 13]|uniref:STAS domain-containing protein n=1 Tax=Bacillus sp. MUM 13 TaxID=1678001 RepID=UPI0008F57ECB|nr:STAS domain-containing protein [Bacillus sp. MUM 13]OIK10488.1 anti-anti-sigma factor [Bacillus sp. MUM 13]
MSTESNLNMNVGGLEFGWDLKKGVFQYENDDAVLFWISSAMKSFFDTIEEISGNDAASVVLETTGYRQGTTVGEYYKSQNLSIAEVASVVPNTYASAGWGKISIIEMNQEMKTATITIENSWESKINIAQGKSSHGTFIPGHFSGLLTGLLETNIWYKEIQTSFENTNKQFIYEFFPSDRTVEQNIHDLARKAEAEHIRSLEQTVNERTRELSELVKEISSPIIPVLEGIVVVPLLGKYDEFRSEELTVKTLYNLPAYKANYLVLDLTGLDKHIDEYTVGFINKLASAAALIGTETILVGISAELGMTIAQTDYNLAQFNCFQTLQHGIYFALSQTGKQII